MRISARFCLLAAMTIIVGWIPTMARAEGFGGPCTSIAPGAILPQPVYFNTTTGSRYIPGKAEFTDSEALPLSDFSATANWGDGTTTPAAISLAGCYVVTAPAHVYTHSGAYPFSYTIHDAHTGLDHEIGTETVYIWGVPQRVDAPSSHVVDATVGVPWSGSSRNSPRKIFHSKGARTTYTSNGKKATAYGRLEVSRRVKQADWWSAPRTRSQPNSTGTRPST
jgi:hypothetical protein